MKKILIILIPTCFGYCVGVFITMCIFKEFSLFSCIPEIVLRANYRRKEGVPEKSFIRKIRRLDKIVNFMIISCLASGVISILGLITIFAF